MSYDVYSKAGTDDAVAAAQAAAAADATSKANAAQAAAQAASVAKGNLAVNVKDYGAVGDGVTDDSTAIRAAITAGTGGAVHFAPGKTYVITGRSGTIFRALAIPADTTLVGYGATLKLKDAPLPLPWRCSSRPERTSESRA